LNHDDDPTRPAADDALKPKRRSRRAAAVRIVDGRSIGTRALVLVPQPPRGRRFDADRQRGADAPALPPLHAPEDRLAEATGLARAIDLTIVDGVIVPLPAPRPATLFGTGKVEEVGKRVELEEIGLIVVDHPLTPIQQRNLEKEWKAKVLDRTGLILEIFGRRAQTREGRLQVELAHLTYQKSRLVRSWTHLERQRGGAGFLGGPGESQLELDRRMIEEKIEVLKRDLAVVVRTREVNRANRKKVPYAVVALVGYTNAGKSTLFNAITGAGVLAKDQVFATLDPTLREVKLPSGRRIILSDTVGFISDLPTLLVAAFRATLEEVLEAEVILHVRDIAHEESEAQAADVRRVLHDLGVDTTAADVRLMEVWNKADRLDADAHAARSAEAVRMANLPPVLVSALTREGIPLLLDRVNAILGADEEEFAVTVDPTAGKLLHWLHEHTEVVEKSVDDAGVSHLRVRVAAGKRGRFDHQIRQSGARLG
jgi:GTP-binding protein HflX